MTRRLRLENQIKSHLSVSWIMRLPWPKHAMPIVSMPPLWRKV